MTFQLGGLASNVLSSYIHAFTPSLPNTKFHLLNSRPESKTNLQVNVQIFKHPRSTNQRVIFPSVKASDNSLTQVGISQASNLTTNEVLCGWFKVQLKLWLSIWSTKTQKIFLASMFRSSQTRLPPFLGSHLYVFSFPTKSVSYGGVVVDSSLVFIVRTRGVDWLVIMSSRNASEGIKSREYPNHQQ